MQIEPFRAARFSRRLVIYEDPAVANHLDEIAATVGASTASLVRSAIRSWLRAVGPSSARKIG